MSGFWSVFIIVLVVIQMVGSLWLLHSLRTKPKDEGEGDTTEHVWDTTLREFNNPLPRWWLWLFWLTAIWLVAYLVIYPGFGNFAGTLGWTQQGAYEAEVAAAEKRYGDIYAAFDNMDLAAMSNDPDAVRLGRNLFLNNCATCHGADARGAKGFPDLTDAAWLWGATPQAIEQSIRDGRIGVMPALGAALGEEGTDQVTSYLLSLSGRQVDAVAAEAGKAKFAQFCISCHGPDAKGMQVVGGPDLTDAEWLHGGNRAAIKDVIERGRVNQMPAQKDLLSADRIRTLVAYILSVGARE